MSIFCIVEKDFLKEDKKKWKKAEIKWKEAEFELEKAVAYNKELQDKILKVCEHKH